MASVTWVGGAAAVSQVQSFTFAGTWEVGDVIRVSVGQKVWDYPVTSTTIATFFPLFLAAYNALSASDYPEMAEMTCAGTSPTATFTADTAGRPFTITLTPLESNLSAADAQTIEGAGVATTGTATTASAGPNDWSTLKNWSGGALPANSDSVYFENNDDDVKYGLAQSGVTLTLLEIKASFTGTVGLPIANADATEYPEYRARALAISATTLNVGAGDGQGSGRLLINTGTAQTALTVYGTAGGLDTDLAALQWKGTHASNVVNVLAGSADVAWFAAEAATVATLRVGYETSQDSDAAVRCSSGVTLTTVVQNGGNLVINSAATTVTKHAGTLSTFGSGAITTLHNYDGAFNFGSTGTITTYNGGAGSTLTRASNLAAVTVTTANLTPGATVSDDAGVVVWTNGIALTRGRVRDYSIDVGFNRTLTPS